MEMKLKQREWNAERMKQGELDYYTLDDDEHFRQFEIFQEWMTAWEVGSFANPQSGGPGHGEIDVGRLWKAGKGNINKYDLWLMMRN